MELLKAVVDLFMTLVLLRLLVRPNEAFFHPLYGLLYRVTDPIVTPARYITRTPAQGILLTILVLVAVRGGIYASLGRAPLLLGMGTSLLELARFVFQAYMVLWVVAVAAGHPYGRGLIDIMARAFVPVDAALARLGVPRSRFMAGSFLLLWAVYAIVSAAIQGLLLLQDLPSPMVLVQGLAEGLILFLALFPFPGFFSLVIIAGAILSWVSPDPRNPIVQALYGISEPLLAPFRRLLPNLGGIDLSPILALLAFQILGGLGQQAVLEALKALR
jgi:YggT family protein